jgi:CRISPR-associated protein Cas1
MRVLYVVEQGAVLRRAGELLLVERDRETLARVPLLRLQLVLLFGNVHVTTPTLATLLERGIELVLLTADGEYRGRLVGPESGSAELRVRQLEAARDEGFALELARRFVRGKLRNQGVLLLRELDEHPDLRSALDALRDALLRASRAGGLGGLLASEGYGSGAYFTALAQLLPASLGFSGRQRRPPPDPVNALLSLGYTLLTQRAVSALRAVGLDPSVGFLHQFRPGRPSLALDLLEAAKVDGAGFFTIYRRVILPLSATGFVVVAIWQFTSIWNEFLFGLVITNSPQERPVTVALQNIAGSQYTMWNVQMAGALLVALPTLLVYILLGRYFLRGLLAGSLKG